MELERSIGIEGEGFGSVDEGMPEMVEEIEEGEEDHDGGGDGQG